MKKLLEDASLTTSVLFNHFLPGMSTKKVLQLGNAFTLAVSKHFSVHSIVCDTQFAIFISIAHMKDLNAVCQYWYAMCFQ